MNRDEKNKNERYFADGLCDSYRLWYRKFDTSRKEDYRKLIIGDWYQQWSDSLTFSIYDDGTVNVPGSYGLGKWSLVNDNQLILSDFYGETIILKIENIDADNMEVRQVIDGKESQESITFWHTAEGAQTIRVKGYH